MLVEAWTNEEFARVLKRASLMCPDGKPLAVVLSLAMKQHQERVCGMDMVPDLISAANKFRLKIFFVGPNHTVVNKIVERVNEDFPGADLVAGFFIPEVSCEVSEYNQKIVDEINGSDADMVFVSLGCPKQELWMFNHYKAIPMPLLGVGGALAIHAGLQRRAPNWMQSLGLEWFFRLILEPNRLWRRYLITNFLFIYYIAKNFLKNKKMGSFF